MVKACCCQSYLTTIIKFFIDIFLSCHGFWRSHVTRVCGGGAALTGGESGDELASLPACDADLPERANSFQTGGVVTPVRRLTGVTRTRFHLSLVTSHFAEGEEPLRPLRPPSLIWCVIRLHHQPRGGGSHLHVLVVVNERREETKSMFLGEVTSQCSQCSQ